MSLLSAAERLAAIDRSAVVLDTQACLHSHDQRSTCEACFTLCPVEAIEPGKPPALDAESCQTCLACIPACPVGAYSADDAVQPLLTCAARIESNAVELLCELHGSAEMSASPDSTGIRLRGCLAGLGSGAYLALVALGLEKIDTRIDACTQCPWGSLSETIEMQVDEAKELLSAWGMSDALNCIRELDEQVERPLWEAENPPLSRRDLFRMAARQGQVTMARAMTVERPSGERRPGPDRMRIAGAISHLTHPPQKTKLELAGDGFAKLSVSDACSACATCARACPTGALEFVKDGDKNLSYQLKFSPQNCIGCELCIHVCAPEAITVDHAPTFAEIFGSPEPVVLSEGELLRCENCSALFATKPNKNLCPVCEFRRKNPFGSAMPPGVEMAIKHSKGRTSDDH